jgi:hypothetical protein
MRNHVARSVLLVAFAASLVFAGTSGDRRGNADKSSQAKLRTPDRTACVWTGKEMLVWDSPRRMLALDPENNAWRTIAMTLPRGRISPQRLLRSPSGTVLAVYWAIDKNTQLCFDRYSPNPERWKRVAAFDRKVFRDEDGKPYETFDTTNNGKKTTWFNLEIAGMAAVPEGAVTIVGSGQRQAMGVFVGDDGKSRLISRRDAPKCHAAWDDTAVYAFGDKVLCYSYAHVISNMWGVWDAKKDTWSKPEKCDRRYAFSHCQLGDEVYIFGGAESSAFGWIKTDGAIYSFSKAKWRPLPMQDGPSARRDGVMCSTGKKILLWGGDRQPGNRMQNVPFNLPLNRPMAFDPAKQMWETMPSQGEPPARCYCQAVWTGKEMIVWGGRCNSLHRYRRAVGGYAYDPETGRWRKLPETPKAPE